MKTKTSVKSGGQQWNHNQSTAGMKVQSNVKAGLIALLLPAVQKVREAAARQQ